MVIGVLVLGAVSFAVAFQAPPPPSATAGSQNLAQETWDAVDALNKMHYPDASFGNSTLSKVVADAAAGDEEPLVDSLSRFMPDGAEFQVYLNNGYDRFPLYTNKSPAGQTAAVAYPFEPNWQHHYAATDLRVYKNNSDTAMGTTLIPLFNSHHVQDEGQNLRARVDGMQDQLPGQDLQTSAQDLSFTEDAYSTLLQGDDTVSYPSAEIHLQCERTNGTVQPCYAIDLTGSKTDGYDPLEKTVEATWQRLDFKVYNRGPGTVGENSTLTLDFPVGLEVEENATAVHDRLKDIRYQGTYPDTQTVKATLNGTEIPSGEAAELEVWVRVDDSRYAYKTIDAYLEGGAVSSSQFLAIVNDKSGGTFTGGDTRKVLVSAPKPAGAVSGSDLPTGRWGVVMPVPSTRQAIHNITLTLTERGGEFADVRYPSDWIPEWPKEASGGDNDLSSYSFDSSAANPPSEDSTLKVKATDIEWGTNASDDHIYPAYTFVEIQFVVTTDGQLTEASPEFPFARPQAEFRDFLPPGQSTQVEPGIWWSEYPPEAGTGTPDTSDDLPGYGSGPGNPGDGNPLVERTFESVITHRNSKISGETIYREADLQTSNDPADAAQGAVKDAVHASRLTVTPQRVSPGETAQLTLDSQDLASYVSSTVGLQHMNLTTYIYAPWGIPDERPVKTYVHDSGTGPLNAPNDLMAGWLNADDAQDVVVASSDGNVYGVSGDNGNTIATKIFEVPQGNTGDDTAQPTMLERGFAPGEGQFYAVGTGNSISNWYTFDEDFEQRWKASKPGGSVKTLGINISRDLDGDDIPDVVASHSTADATETASLITVRSGADGTLLPGWNPDVSSDKVVPGSATQLGMGNLGSEAGSGVYVNTGFQVSAETDYDINEEDPVSDDLDPNANLSLAWSISETGLVGYYDDGRRAWNYSGGEFVDLTTSEAMDTDAWSGVLATDREGWMYGFNASQPLPPVAGPDFVAYDRMTDIAMANPLEAYVASPDGGLMLATDDGWGSYLGSTGVVTGADQPPVHAVDTPDGPYLQGYGNVSWWAGDAGTLLRSTDRIETVEGLTTTGQLAATINLDSSSDDLTETVLGLSTDTIDLTNINFRGVLAVSHDEAWFVGHGISGTTLDQHGYIVHTEDGGETMDVFEIECIDGGTTLDDCGVNSIGRSDGDIWVAGESGMVLVQERSGSATDVTLEGSPGFVDLNGYGNLVLNLTASSPANIRNVTVDWKPDTDLDWMRGVRLRDGLPDLWNASEECCHDGTLSTGDGASDGTTVFVDEYVAQDTTPETDATRTIDGDIQLLTGPFKQTLLPTSGYFAASHYDSLDTNFTLNVTFDDGSQDVYLVDLHDDGTWDVEELASAGWRMPSQVGYDVPDTCFGQPKSECTTYYGLNFTETAQGTTGAIVGAPQGNWSTSDGQAPIVRLGPGSSTFEPLWNMSVNQTFRDVAINPANSSRWLVVGDGGRVIGSWDEGKTWIDLQAPQDVDDTAMAVDYTHPEVAEIVGQNRGDGHAFKWTLGGYREYGRTTTVQLPRTAGEPGPLEKVAINTSFLNTSGSLFGLNHVEIEIWDDGYGGWSTVYLTSDGWVNHSSTSELSTYEYSGPTDEVQLRFTLYTAKAASRWSSQIRGNATIDGYTDASADPNATIEFNIADASQFQDLGKLNHSTEHGYLRLPSVDLPWVLKLGNKEAGPWNETKSRFTAPRINDADVSPDGEIAFVGTAGIYDYTTDTQVSHDGSPAYDNSLYRVKVATGKIDWSWGPLRFDEPIHEVRVGDEAVYVFTKEDTTTSAIGKITRISLSDPTLTHNTSILSTRSLKSMEIVDAFPDNNNVGDDVVLSLKDDNTNDGLLQAHEAPTVTLGWVSRPSLKGSFDFDYDVPRSAMFGTNVVVTEITWNVTDEHGQDILQTAKVHNSFAITPPNGRMPLSPSYNLEVVAWMEDWG